VFVWLGIGVLMVLFLPCHAVGDAVGRGKNIRDLPASRASFR